MAMLRKVPSESVLKEINPILEEIEVLRRKHTKFFKPDNKELMVKLKPLIISLAKKKNKANRYMLSYDNIADILGWSKTQVVDRVLKKENISRKKKKGV